MDNKKLITILSIVVTSIIVIISAILIINENNKSAKTVVTEQKMENQEVIESIENIQEETSSPSPNPSASPTPYIPQGKYYIKVNNQANTVTIYTKDEEGNYTVPVKAMVCSTGYASPKNCKHQLKYRWPWLKMNGGVYAQYVTQISGHILFHSVPYLKPDPSTLEYWLYDKLGTTCSAGCIRLTTADAIWIYNNCASGTTVEFYNSPDPGPLGKPSAMKINLPKYAGYQNWDPTDPRPDNPWRNYVEETPTPSIEPSPEVIPSVEPSTEPIVTPSTEPSATPSVNPTSTPSIEPSTKPTVTPSVKPTTTPSVKPSATPVSSATPASSKPTPTPTQQPVVPDETVTE